MIEIQKEKIKKNSEFSLKNPQVTYTENEEKY